MKSGIGVDERWQHFEDVYQSNLDYVWASLKRLGVASRDLEDVAHEVFLVAYRSWEKYDTSRPLRPWLFGIAFRVASDWRKKASHAREFLIDPEPPSRPARAVRKLQADQAREVVMEALGAVNIERRAVFVLHELDGHAIPQVAEALCLPLNTAYSRLRLAREEFTAAARRIVSQEDAI